MNAGLVTIAAACGLALASLASGQDRRAVVEPRPPALCRRLDAALPLTTAGLADSDERHRDTERIQEAFDTCPEGTAIALGASGANRAFLSGPLSIRRGVTLLVEHDVVLVASRDPRDYDVAPGRCGTVDRQGGGCKPLLRVTAHNAAIMGDGTIDGRGGSTLRDTSTTWWDLAEQARPPGLHQNVPRLIVAEQADNFVLHRITLRNSANFHVSVHRTTGFTAWGVRIDTPRTARNTDGIDPISSSDVTITESFIRTGDDHVAIKAGSTGPSSHITVSRNHFYSGHGLSIGSETNGGVSAVMVDDLSIEGADNGLRIKSNATRGGLVTGVTYTNVCLAAIRNPIVLDSFYERVSEGPLMPEFRDITIRRVQIRGGGLISLLGADATHPVQVRLDDVTTVDTAPRVKASHARVSLGPGPVTFALGGDDVDTKREATQPSSSSCDTRFVPFPVPR